MDRRGLLRDGRGSNWCGAGWPQPATLRHRIYHTRKKCKVSVWKFEPWLDTPYSHLQDHRKIPGSKATRTSYRFWVWQFVSPWLALDIAAWWSFPGERATGFVNGGLPPRPRSCWFLDCFSVSGVSRGAEGLIQLCWMFAWLRITFPWKETVVQGSGPKNPGWVWNMVHFEGRSSWLHTKDIFSALLSKSVESETTAAPGLPQLLLPVSAAPCVWMCAYVHVCTGVAPSDSLSLSLRWMIPAWPGTWEIVTEWAQGLAYLCFLKSGIMSVCVSLETWYIYLLWSLPLLLTSVISENTFFSSVWTLNAHFIAKKKKK